MYDRRMLRRTSIYLDSVSLKSLERIGKRKGLKTAQVIRLALSEYVAREEKRA